MTDSPVQSRSVPGLLVSDIWKRETTLKEKYLSPHSDGSSLSVLGERGTLEAAAAALETYDKNRKRHSRSAGGEICTAAERLDSIGPRSDLKLTTGSKVDFEFPEEVHTGDDSLESDKGQRPRSVSEVVDESRRGSVAEVSVDAAAISNYDNPSVIDNPSVLELPLSESFERRHLSTSSQPESIDSTSVSIMLNRDNASTVAQSGSLGEPDGLDVVLGRRTTALARHRRSSFHRQSRRRRRRRAREAAGLTVALQQALESVPTNATHVAVSHDDTSPGALHRFQDEFGR